jgi:hypothetical protein
MMRRRRRSTKKEKNWERKWKAALDRDWSLPVRSNDDVEVGGGSLGWRQRLSVSRRRTGDLLNWWNQRRQIHRDLATRVRESEVISEQNKTCQFLRSYPCRPRSLTGDSSIMHRVIPSIAYANGVSVDVKFRDLRSRRRSA